MPQNAENLVDSLRILQAKPLRGQTFKNYLVLPHLYREPPQKCKMTEFCFKGMDSDVIMDECKDNILQIESFC